MKNLKLFTLLFLAAAIMGSCSKLKESPDPDTTDTDTTSSSGGGNSGNAAVYVGLWKMTDKSVGGTSVFATLDTIPEVHLQTAATAKWNYYVGGNIAKTESDIYSLNTSSNPVTINFSLTGKGIRTIVTKTGSQMVWKFNDPNFLNQEVIETYDKQ